MNDEHNDNSNVAIIVSFIRFLMIDVAENIIYVEYKHNHGQK